MTAAYPKAVRQLGFVAMAGRAAAVRRAPCASSDRQAQPPAPRRRTVVRLWIPATAIFWLLSPLPLLLAPLACLAPPAYRPANPYAAVLAIGRLLTSMSGTVVHVDSPEALVSLRIL